MDDIFGIEEFNIISDDENYYFFRALNKGDNKDFESSLIVDEEGKIKEIRTDSKRYPGKPKYDEKSKLSLEEMFDHIKVRHRVDTNCISLTSNANAAILYGRNFYKDRYIMVKVPKKEFGRKVVMAGSYMMQEIEKLIKIYASPSDLDPLQKYYLDCIDYSRTQEALDRTMDMFRKIKGGDSKDDLFEGGITYHDGDINSIEYQALNDKQNLQKNKLVAKLNVIAANMLPRVKNKFLIQTLGNAFSSLELIHYSDIEKKEILQVSSTIVDVFSLLQQLTTNHRLVEELKVEIINYVKSNSIHLDDKFYLDKLHLNNDSDYTIEKMYDLTNGNVSYFDSINLYKKSFYLAKSKLRSEKVAEFISEITNDNPRYRVIIEQLINNTYGVEPEIFSRQTSNKMKVSESVSLDFSQKEKPFFKYINSLNKNDLISILNNPTRSLQFFLKKFHNINNKKVDKETYYANAIIDLFDWSKLNIVNMSDRQRNHILESLVKSNVVEVYNKLKEKNVKEKDIANALLTVIIKGKSLEKIDDLNLKETFTVRELEDFLGYYKINNTKGLKLRDYQAQAVNNIDKIFCNHQFATAILPTGAGKSFVALAEMLRHSKEDILYLAPNDEILNQIKRNILDFICDEDATKSDDEKITEKFPKLKLCTYHFLLSENKNGILNDKVDKTINNKYGLIVFDELHRSGASEWERSVLELLGNQDKKTKILGITATPQRDVDYRNMDVEWAKYFGYTDEEIMRRKHVAINMDLFEAIRLGYVINPKIVNCEYSLQDKNGLLDNLLEKINLISDEEEKQAVLKKYDDLRRKVKDAEGVSEILKANIKKGGNYIVFCPVVNNEGERLENEDGNSINYRLASQEVIQKFIEQLKSDLGDEYDLEFYSMLGEYSKSKNQSQLSSFEKTEPKKTKIMVVLNKLNEGVHVKGLDGMIWYRPLDENSTILFYQQLGRVIYGVDPNKEIPEDMRPIVIDLVNNTLRVNLEKDSKTQFSDLDKITLIQGWIENHHFPDINSFDRVESSYAVSLKRIQTKYIKYINEQQLLDKVSLKEKEEILAIIDIASSIGLWNVDFPDKIVQSKDRKQEIFDELSFFKLTGILRDFCELDSIVNDIIYVSPEEKKEELIKSIHELKRLPKVKEDGVSERIFKDGTDQRSYYNNLQTKYNNLVNKPTLIDAEKQVKKDYEEIKAVLSEYVIYVSPEEKKEELIKSIRELKGLPVKKANNNGISERTFKDGTDQRHYYDGLQFKYKKLVDKPNLTEDEEQVKKDYEEINAVLSEYVISVSTEEKKKELIKSIRELKGLPRKKANSNDISERTFKDGTDQRSYYENLKSKYNKLTNKPNLTDDEKQAKKDYEEINAVFSEYYVSPEEKKEELIKSIRELKRVPRQKADNNGVSERTFKDGTDQRHYYDGLQFKYKKLVDKPNLTEDEEQVKKDYEEINAVLSEYVISVSTEEKKKELIKSIRELKGLPVKKANNNGISERTFKDGTDQRHYYNYLQKKYNKLTNKPNLTEDEEQVKKDYEEINAVFSEYYVSPEEKKEELIKSIHELKRLPVKKAHNNGVSERTFKDGTDQRHYYDGLQFKYKKLVDKPNLTEDEEQVKKDNEEINAVLSEYVNGDKKKELAELRDSLMTAKTFSSTSDITFTNQTSDDSGVISKKH